MTGTNCDLFTHNQSRSYLNHLVKYKISEQQPLFFQVSANSLLSPSYEDVLS